MQPAASTLCKQVLFLTKLILSFLIIGILLFLNFLDLKESNNNRTYLGILKSVADKNSRAELKFKDYELPRLDSLQTLEPGIYRKHVNSRTALVNNLNRYGAFITRANKGGGTDKKNSIILMINDSLKSMLGDGGDYSTVFNNSKRGYSDFNQGQTVNDAIEIFNSFPLQEKVELLTAIDTAVLVKKCDSILNDIKAHQMEQARVDSIARISLQDSGGLTHPNTRGIRIDYGTGGPESFVNSLTGKDVEPAAASLLFGSYHSFQGLFVQPKKVVLILNTQHNDNPGANPFQGNPGHGAQGNQGSGMGMGMGEPYTIEVPAETETVTLPSTLFFAGYPPNALLEMADKDKQEDLANLYGSADLNMVDNISVDLYNKNNQPVSILGFDLSRKWFPLALFVVLAIIAALLFKDVRTAKVLKYQMISGGDNDDVVQFLITNRYIRFFLWVITPALLFVLVLYASFIHYNTAWFMLMIAGCITAVLLGLIAFLVSEKL